MQKISRLCYFQNWQIIHIYSANSIVTMTNLYKTLTSIVLGAILLGISITVNIHQVYAPPEFRYGAMTSGSNAGGFSDPNVGSTITGSAATNDPAVTMVKFQWLNPDGDIIQTSIDTSSTNAGGTDCLTAATKYTGGIKNSDITGPSSYKCFSNNFSITLPPGDWGMKAAFCTSEQSCSPPEVIKQRAISFVAGSPPPCMDRIFSDRCIDADGTATKGNGLMNMDNVQAYYGAPLTRFPILPGNYNGAWLGMFDNDGDNRWTFGPVGDDLHVEGLTFCPTAIHDEIHQVGKDCVVLDMDRSLYNGQPVSCDLYNGAYCVAPLPRPITFFDANNNGAWDDGEDIILDRNLDGIFN